MPSMFDSFPDFMTEPDTSRLVVSSVDQVGNVLCSVDVNPAMPNAPIPCVPPPGGSLRTGFGKQLSTVGYGVIAGGLLLAFTLIKKG